MIYRIHFWHGITPDPALRTKNERVLIDKLKSMSHTVVAGPNNEYDWYGTLDQFFEEYQDQFMVLNGAIRDRQVPLICVTQHNNFGQR